MIKNPKIYIQFMFLPTGSESENLTGTGNRRQKMKMKKTLLIINAFAVLLVQSVMAQTPKAELKKITESVYSYTGALPVHPVTYFPLIPG